MERIHAKIAQIKQSKELPKNAQIITNILRSLECEDYEPRVVNQLLEFTYRYVTTVLEEAKVYANHCDKMSVELSDVMLATMVVNRSYAEAPPRDVLFEAAKEINSRPLPAPISESRIRLPPHNYCLTAPNFCKKNRKIISLRVRPAPEPLKRKENNTLNTNSQICVRKIESSEAN